jgi:hypothetical protein
MLEEQKLRFQGADRFAALRGPFPPGVLKVSGACPARPTPPRWPWRSGVVPGVVARPSEAAGGGVRHHAGDSAVSPPSGGPLCPSRQRQMGIVPGIFRLFCWGMASDGSITTFSGVRFWPLLPNPDDILIADIAHALAHQCRFAGHAREFYSVAEHCVRVSHLCAPEDALWGLLHDASEAYLSDVPAPMKELPAFEAYRAAERSLQRAVAARFGLPEDQPASVTQADDTMLWIEAHSLLGSMPVEVIRDTRPPFEITDPLLPVEAERLFLTRFKELSA